MADPRRIEWVRLGEARPAELNPKSHDIGEICVSITSRGFVELPVIDERTNRLVAGHGRFEALAALRRDGHALPKGLMQAADGEWLVPVVRGWRSRNDADAAAYLVASNRLTEMGGWNDSELTKLLKFVATEGGAEMLAGTGFDGDDIDALNAKVLADMKGPQAVAERHQLLVTCPDSKSAARLTKRLKREGFEVLAPGPMKHGGSNRPEYEVWVTMRQRCTNPKAKDFPNYGGRGITVDPRWDTFEAFFADMGPRPKGTSIDRLDNSKGYGPGNCAWRTFKEQANNRRPRRKRGPK